MNLTVTSGDSVLITCESSPSDFGFYDPPEVAPSHGSLTFGDGTNIYHVRYQNDGTGTTDTFTLKRGTDNTLVVFNVTIQQPPSSITISPSALSLSIGTAYNGSLTATGGSGPYSFAVTSGTLPTGISLASDGTLSGTPTGYGTYVFSVTATDSTSATGTRSYSGTIPPPTITIAPSTLPGGTVSTSYSQSLSSSGGTSPYTYAIDGGALPPGLSLSSTGVISGTPTTAGTYSGIVIKSTDSSSDMSGAMTNGVGTRTYSITVSATPTIVVTPSSVADATVGTTYTPTSFTASGGTAPYNYTVSTGSLPAGMNLSSGGTLSGTPTEGGAFNFTVQAKDANNFTGTQAVTLTVNAPTITVGPGTVPNPQVGVPYSQQFTASGGTQGSGYTFATSGTVPAGLSMSGSGLLSGTPTSATGSASFTVTATDHSTGTGAPYSGSQAYTVSVAGPTLSISPASGTTLTAATQNSSYSQQFTASGGTNPYTYQVTGGTLPNGLSLGVGGQLSGTPTEAGTFNFTVTASDSSTGTGSPFTVSGSYTLHVQAITPVANPVSITVPYHSSSNVVPTSFTGGTPSSVAAVTPASHGTATASGTTITYTPNAGYAGADSFTYTGTNTAGTSAPATVSITVSDPTLSLSAGSSLTTQVGQSYTQTFTFSGGKAPYSGYSVSGIPAGLSVTGFNNTSITISGTPTASGSFTLTVGGTDASTGNGPFAISKPFTLTINKATLSLSPSTLPNATTGTAYSQSISASGGVAPYTYAVTAGALPAGVNLSSSGALNGTPTAGGSFNFTVTATDSSTGSGSPATVATSYTLNVAAPTVTLTPTTLPTASIGNSYNQTITATGGVGPYTYARTSGSLPTGMSLSPGGVLSGTPSAGGSFNFTVTATDSSTGSGPYTGSRAYTLTVAVPTITVTPSTLPQAQQGTAYSQNLSASGGIAPYAYARTSGSMPTGMSLSPSGVLSGTPTAAGSYNFTVTATDASGGTGPYTGSQAYTLVVSANPPVVNDDTASTPSQQAVTIPVTNNDTGNISSIAVAGAPTHGTTTVNGLSVKYTPTGTFFGTDTFTYTATGPGGTSTPATVTVTVAALAVPTAKNQSVTVLAGKSVSMDATAGATGGPYTSATIVKTPDTGTAKVSGTHIAYAAPADASGAHTFTYTLSNAYGTSKPATVSVQINPLPQPVPLQAKAISGRMVQVNLTAKAHGGPFTGADLVAIMPSTAGTAKITQSDDDYMLQFTPASAYSGTAKVTYTLSNAYATSAPGTVTITVTSRPDPSKDAEVRGILSAQTNATRRLARGQLDNFERRLESLHNGGSAQGFQNNLSFVFDGGRRNQLHGPSASPDWGSNLDDPNRPFGDHTLNPRGIDAAPKQDRHPGDPHALAFWAGGAVNFGTQKLGGSHNGIDFTTSGITLGADKRVSDHFAFGAGVGYGHDASNVGHNGSRSTSNAYNVATYASYRPGETAFIDGLLGYQRLSFDARRYVTANGNFVHGSRDGSQIFGSLSTGFSHHHGNMLLSPYGRVDIASAKLDAYTEHGDAIYALHYNRQTVRTTTGSLGLRMNWALKRDFGMLLPMLRIEYRHDFQGNSDAVMRYADLPAGPLYRTSLDDQARNHALLGIGLQTRSHNGFTFRVEYQNLIDNSSSNNQTIQLNLAYPFKP